MNEGQQTPLSELLDEPSEAPEVVDTPQPEVEAELPAEEAGRLRDESGRFAKKGGEGASPAPEQEPPLEHAAVKGERTRRQAAEKDRDELRAELEAIKQRLDASQPKEEPQAPPSIWEDENGALQHYGQRAVSEASLNARLDTSEMLAYQAHEDFDEMKAKFIEMMAVNPALQRQALESRHPWETAYKLAKNAASAQELGATNIEELRATLREQIMAELQQGATPVPQQQPAIPPTLTTERNVGARSGPAWAGPKSLEELLPH